MKLQGIAGKGTGKLGAHVWSVRKGVQIIREYTDKVSNPNTRPQVEQRAKFKLLTQLAAAIGDDGMFFMGRGAGVSMRNEFMRHNMGAVEVLPGASVATLKTGAVALTDGSFVFDTPVFDLSTASASVDLTNPDMEHIAGAAFAVITQPEMGRVIGYSQRITREEGASKIEMPVFVPAAMINRSAVLVWLWRFRDAAARANYNATIARDPDNINLSFNRFVEQGDIVVSFTEMATRTGTNALVHGAKAKK